MPQLIWGNNYSCLPDTGFGVIYIVDVTRSLDRAMRGRLPTGVDRVILEYIKHFQQNAQALVRWGGRWIVMRPQASQEVFSALSMPDASLPWTLRRWVAREYAFSWNTPGEDCLLLNIGHSGLQDADYGLRVKTLGWRALYFLHDLIPITHPEYCRAGEAVLHRQRLQTMFSTAGAIVVNSAATLADLQAYAQGQGVALPPCVVAHLAPGRLPAASPQRPLQQPYFVMLGTIEPRKNHLLVLQVWRQLVAQMKGGIPRLVLVGQRGWECEQVLDLLERCDVLRGVVLEQPRCSDQELATWLAHAQALLFPSFAEGYGMPLVEALSVGLPVLASDLPAFREVAQDIPEYLDPLDGPAWAQAIMDYMPNAGNQRRQAQCCRMAEWQAPTWGAHFARVDDMLQRSDVGLA